MITRQLLDYILQQTQSGKTSEEIKQTLQAQGWSNSDIDSAFSGSPNDSNGVPIPNKTQSRSTMESIWILDGKIRLIFLTFFVILFGAFYLFTRFQPALG